MAGINLNLNAITENTSRLGARIQETFIEHTRDLAITRGPGAAYFDVSEDKIRNIRKQLETNSDREKLDALKTIIALISKGRNVSDYFPSVVKNVASPNIEIRKLVYIFLLRYAETEPDLALLSINTFQRDLTDPNPLIRAMALRVLSGINVPMVGNIVILAVKKCANDPSPYVRKAAALAVIKCYSMDSAYLPALIPIITTLLKDKSPLSIGSVAIAFQAICPTRLDLLHTHYRRLCRMLLDIDPWGQVQVLELLGRYARTMLPKPGLGASIGDKTEGREDIDPDLQLLLSSSEPLFMSRNPSVVMAVARVFYYLAPSSQLIKVASPLLRLLPVSREIERVVLANVAIIVDEHPALFSTHYSRFLVRTTDLRQTKQLKLHILQKLLSLENYQALLREFIACADDLDAMIASDAVHAIGGCAIAVPESTSQCLAALMDFIKRGSDQAIPPSVLVLKTLVQARLQIRSEAQSLSGGHSPLRIIADLASRIDEINHASARACVIWLVGQYADQAAEFQDTSKTEGAGLEAVAWWAPDVLRSIARTFPTEAPIVKLQALTLAAKLQVLITSYHHSFTLLARYIFSLARYDINYDVRDRARLLSGLLVGIAPHLQQTNGNVIDDWDRSEEVDTSGRGGVVLRREQVKLILFEGKLETQQKESPKGRDNVLGSLQVITSKSTGLESSLRLPDWPEEGTDSSLRDSPEDYPSVPVSGLAAQRAFSSGASGASGRTPSPVVLTPTGRESPGLRSSGTGVLGQWKSLDEFYEESESEEEDAEESQDENGQPMSDDLQGQTIASNKTGQEEAASSEEETESEEEEEAGSESSKSDV